MEVKKLRHFAVTAEYESLSTAAEKLGLGIPALSRSIKRLEESINGKLFDRTGHGLKLTELGKTLLEYAHTIIREHDRAVFAIEGVTKQKSGVLRIGVVRYLASFGLAPAIIGLVRRFPKAGIEVIDSTYEELLLKLLNAEVDVVIAILTARLSHHDLVAEPVVKSNLLYAVGKSHPLAKKKSVTLAELRESRCIISNRPAYIRAHYESSGTNEQSNQHPLIVSSPALARQLLQSGEFFAICSRHHVAHDLRSGHIVELDLPVSKNSLPIGFVTRKSGAQSAMLETFLEQARCALKQASRDLD